LIKACREVAVDSKCSLISVDTWTKSIDVNEEEEYWHTLADHNNVDLGFYEIFMNNIKYQKLTDVIAPLRIPSAQGARVLFCFGVRADFIYIGAGHDYDSTYHDVGLFQNILSDGGVMFGGDYNRPDLIEAVDDYAAEVGVPLIVANDRRTWILHFP
uniref:Lactamase_B domain-containing protein n=1 Tax=Gongylonema pulchrum TaxID=637853 RepID=A0A183CWI4_9BILA